jgi:hypothetical protein
MMAEHTQGNPPTMTNDFTATRKLSQADPVYQQLEQAHTDACKAVHDAAAKPRNLTFKLQRLLLARDAVLHYATETECTDSSQDDFLERTTANHGETWCGMFNAAADDITQLIYEICATITQQRLEHDQLVKAREAAREAKQARWAELERQPVD